MLSAVFSLVAAATLSVCACAQACTRSSAAGPEKASPTLLAKMVDKDDHILYRTDSEELKSSRELAIEEKEKQERAWQMLERTEIYNFPPNRRPRPKQDRPRQ